MIALAICLLATVVSIGLYNIADAIRERNNEDEDMREIKFRGKRIDNGEWVYGSLDLNDERPAISWLQTNEEGEQEPWLAYVKGNTVGQFTGYTDYNNREVYEGDIIELQSATINNHDFDQIQLSVVWLGDSVRLHPADRYYHRGACVDLRMTAAKRGKVIGNVHDNPELLKGGSYEKN